MLFDTNNDGVISFPEYIFFVTLLSVPESSFTVAFKMFDLNNNGQLIETKEAIERQRKLFKKKKTGIILLPLLYLIHCFLKLEGRA
ncbi:hypothetical protein Ahy_B07g086240 isoform C [Arachis hypogaea]|uniref:EF-hand domain-containing protein n=1 Tax=Arachis hypogaea TaxID=3818 RepID=A0A444Y980_ARAHY|nr:hypothetical protein Ahy_B07g086240 isoform C [Arachis hypogaea]